MKVPVLSLQGEKVKTIELPKQFTEAVRPDIIKKAVLVVQSNRRQPYGASPLAGKRYSAKLSRRRRNYKTSYGHGISRVPRKTMLRRGRNFLWMGAFAPGTVGGRRAHPPKAEKDFSKSINKKEKKKAIRSALAATCIKELVERRGHLPGKEVPLVFEQKFEGLIKTKEIKEVLVKAGLEKELERVKKKKIRPGRGKARGRRYVTKKGPILIVSGQCPLLNAARNLQGVEVCAVSTINAELLAPGCIPGRLSIFTENALEKMDKEKLFS